MVISLKVYDNCERRTSDMQGVKNFYFTSFKLCKWRPLHKEQTDDSVMWIRITYTAYYLLSLKNYVLFCLFLTNLFKLSQFSWPLSHTYKLSLNNFQPLLIFPNFHITLNLFHSILISKILNTPFPQPYLLSKGSHTLGP